MEQQTPRRRQRDPNFMGYTYKNFHAVPSSNGRPRSGLKHISFVSSCRAHCGAQHFVSARLSGQVWSCGLSSQALTCLQARVQAAWLAWTGAGSKCYTRSIACVLGCRQGRDGAQKEGIAAPTPQRATGQAWLLLMLRLQPPAFCRELVGVCCWR